MMSVSVARVSYIDLQTIPWSTKNRKTKEKINSL